MLYCLSGPQEGAAEGEYSRCLSSRPSENVFESDRMQFNNAINLSSVRSLTRTIEAVQEHPDSQSGIYIYIY